jgi:ADP-ribose pyrophosphatase YjhB (NUDIX family)
MKINRAVCALIEHNGKFLVVIRCNSENWGLVCGKVDPVETEQQALMEKYLKKPI